MKHIVEKINKGIMIIIIAFTSIFTTSPPISVKALTSSVTGDEIIA